jgi:hypothetical protein
MRRFAIAVAAVAVALSPVAFNSFGGGIHPAHADLGWCDSCSTAAAPVVTPPLHHHK